ncbi:DMT family transporter [Aquibacillus sediminis]|uniref:DMT family transporter n=1 Tax=Aquibacillus sediminis TaxID=2574734 RepID=UPI001108FF21|nr:EamA family transporter [Aquibacillus sediminis]
MGRKLALAYIAMGASLWGIIGIFVTYLYELGFTPIQVVAVRTMTAALFLILVVLYKNRSLFKISFKDSHYFVGTGVISIALFNWCLFRAMEETSISIASVLLYTAPVFVAVIARFIFKEWFTSRKVVALVTTFIGCVLVIGVFPSMDETVSLYGIILGLGAGFFYALYSIFGKLALRKYDTLTVTVYTFIFAACAVTPFSGVWRAFPLFINIKSWLFIIGLGFLSTTLAFLFYTAGLKQIESSQASIIATIEPVVACITSFLIFQERLIVWQYLGVVMVLAAVIIVQDNRTNKQRLLSRGSTIS